MSNRSVVINGRFLGQPLTGVQRYAREMVGAMDVVLSEKPCERTEHPPLLLAPRNAPGLTSSFENICFERTPGQLTGNLWTQFDLPREARGSVLWSPTNSGPLLHGRHVVTIHDAAVFDHPEWFSRKFAAWYRFLLPGMSRRARLVLTVSEFSRARLIETLGLSEEKVMVIPPAANLERFRPLPQDEVRRSLEALNLSQPYALALGSLEPRKNLAGLMQAWDTMMVRGRVNGELKLFIVGGRGSLYRDAGISNPPRNVVLGGFVDDEHLPALYSGATAFVYPSLYEGFGLPPLEAMACGVPVATSCRASLPEVVGDCAVTVDPSDRESMVDGMERLFTDDALRRRLSEGGPARAARFNWKTSAGRVLECLKSVGE